MSDDLKALIAEARWIATEAEGRARAALAQGHGAPAAFLSRVATNNRRLADALERAELPDGWRATEYTLDNGRAYKRLTYVDGDWMLMTGSGHILFGKLEDAMAWIAAP